MNVILESYRNTEMMLFPITYKSDSQVSSRNLDIIVTRLILIDVIEPCLQIESMSEKSKILGNACSESMQRF